MLPVRHKLLPVLISPFLVLVFFGGAGLLFMAFLPRWIQMWAVAFVMFATFKILSLQNVTVPNRRRLALYFLAWPDMNATRYFSVTAENKDVATNLLPLIKGEVGRGLSGKLFQPPTNSPLHKGGEPLPESVHSVLIKTIFGAACIFIISRTIYPASSLMAGWVGLAGILCFLHFGIFSLLAYVWQNSGIPANPIMNRPAAAKSVSEFWRRWNTAFHQIAHSFVFKPAVKVLGTQRAMLLTFLFSGLLHDLIISFPAGGGYGLPTLYFLIQGGGVCAEHSEMGKRILHGIPGRLYTILIVTVPVPFLFHPPFIHQVIIPFLNAIGAL